jgi:large subunit ribosomal protein L16
MSLTMPRRVKYRKSQRGVIKGNATRGNRVSYGEFGLQSLEAGWLSARQIEAGRVAATRFLANDGRLYVRVFPHKPIAKKPLETRMGKGKGETEFWAAVVKPGTMLFEIGGVGEEAARTALLKVAHKLSLAVRFVARPV